MPRLFSGVYGLGSRDFRPEHIIGAYEFATGARSRKDGKMASDGASFMVLGVDHPYEVKSDERPSLLPEGSIAVRFHSIGGWGAITTGKNLGAIIGDFNDFLYERDKVVDELGNPKEIIHVSANPKYGSEKKGAPTSYFMVAAPERIRVNCDLRHVNVVLCCDPKAFTHTNPLDGMSEGGCLVWESEEEGEQAWERLPIWARKQIIEKKIRVFTLPGFQIARKATERADLQLRMQGNAFLGAFFGVSPLLEEFRISQEQFRQVVHNQYVKKFGRLGEAVVQSNMEVMTQGFERVREIRIGEMQAPDRSSLRGQALLPVVSTNGHAEECGHGCRSIPVPEGQAERTPLTRIATFDAEFRAKYGYNQPASALASVGVMAAGSGDTASKYVARRETPLYIPENCTQCMECIAVCPDTALPNCSQELGTILRTAISSYVTDAGERHKMLRLLPEIEKRTRDMMRQGLTGEALPMPQILRKVTNEVNGFSPQAKRQLFDVIDKVPMAYQKANAIFGTPERKSPGGGGIFSIFVSDLCKGCAACVTACGDHRALRMVQETEDVNAEHETGTAFLNLLPDTPQKYLGLYNDDRPQDSKTATLRNMLMVRRNYDALVSGDGACAGCGEKSILRAIAAVTEAYMRPLYHAKADRLRATADRLEKEGVQKLAELKAAQPAGVRPVSPGRGSPASWVWAGRTIRTPRRVLRRTARSPIRKLSTAIVAVMRQEAFNHKELQAIDGRLANGMSRDGHGRAHRLQYGLRVHAAEQSASLSLDEFAVSGRYHRGLAAGRELYRGSWPAFGGPGTARPTLCWIASRMSSTPREYYEYAHFSDAIMTDQEILELPKVWVVGGDGGMGDIGYQNISKVVLQNRPNVKAVMLDTQVYSNTGGQNSDSTPMLGGNDMNMFGAATQGKNVEKKTVAETFLAGPRVAVRRAGVDRQRAQALPGDPRRPGISRHGVLPVLHDLPAGTRRARRHGA